MKRTLFFFMLFSFLRIDAAGAVDFFRGPVSAAMGGGGRAGINGAESVFVNPSLLPLAKGFEFGAIYRDGDVDAGQHRQGWAVGAVDDSEDAYFPGSLHYVRTRDIGRAAGPAEGEVWHVGAAYLVSNQLSVGASAYRLVYDVKNDREYTQWNGSLGFTYLINNDFAVAYTLDNLAGPGSRVPMGLREDMQQGLGLFYRIAEIATIRGDLVRRERFNPDHDLVYILGLESATSQFVVVRMGVRRDEQADMTFWTAGLGFAGPRLRLNYSFEKNQERVSGALHSVDLQLPF